MYLISQTGMHMLEINDYMQTRLWRKRSTIESYHRCFHSLVYASMITKHIILHLTVDSSTLTAIPSKHNGHLNLNH